MSCSLAMIMFLQSYLSQPYYKVGWILGDDKSWGFTWVSKATTVRYWAYNKIPEDSRVPVITTNETCVNEEGKEVHILQYHARLVL